MAPMRALILFDKWTVEPGDRWWVKLGGRLFKYHVRLSTFTPAHIAIDVGLSGAILHTDAWIQPACLVLPVDVNRITNGPFGIELFTCVTMTKRVLGITNWRIQTPMQLKRYIESLPYKNGAYQLG